MIVRYFDHVQRLARIGLILNDDRGNVLEVVQPLMYGCNAAVVVTRPCLHALVERVA